MDYAKEYMRHFKRVMEDAPGAVSTSDCMSLNRTLATIIAIHLKEFLYYSKNLRSRCVPKRFIDKFETIEAAREAWWDTLQQIIDGFEDYGKHSYELQEPVNPKTGKIIANRRRQRAEVALQLFSENFFSLWC